MSESRADCVIVGGGIGGAVLALLLGRKGKHVVILEKETQPLPAARPEILARSTLEIFRQIDLSERIQKEAALELKGLELYRSREKLLLSFSAADFAANQTQPYSTDPALTRQILLEAAQATQAVEVKRGVEVKELLEEEQKVAGVRAVSGGESLIWRSPLVVGDDGSHSRVRQALGIRLKLREFPLEFLGAEGPELPGGKPDVGQAWLEPSGIRKNIFGGIFMPQPGNRTAFVFLLSPESRRHFETEPAKFYEALHSFSPRCLEIEKNYSFPKNFTVFHRPFGHAPRYVADGAALIGDAAHPLTPAGGQGANASVADAAALARVALQAFEKNNFSMKQLFSYEMERRPANERSLQFSVWANRVFQSLRILPGLGALLFPFLESVNRNPQAKNRFLQNITRAFQSTPRSA